MRNLANRKQETLGRWRELIVGLRRGVDDLASSFLTELAKLPAYQSGLVDQKSLRRSAHDSIALLLDSVAHGRTTTDSSDLPTELGKLRAHQGVPVEDLVAAVRLDFGVIWSALLWRANSTDMTALAMHVDSLWAVVDDYARAVHHSYLAEKAVMATSTRDEQQTYLAELFGPSGQVPSKLAQIATALSVDAETTFRVVVSGSEQSQALHRAASQCGAMGEQMFVLNQPDRVVALWPASDARRSGLDAEAQTRLTRTVTGGFVPDTAGLSAVPAAADIAHEIRLTIKPDEAGLITLSRAWARVTKSRLDVGHDFSTNLLVGINGIGEDERDRILETVRAYLSTGSITDAAAKSFCHRNTVLNRLGRFESLTGLDVTVPEQAALALLALA